MRSRYPIQSKSSRHNESTKYTYIVKPLRTCSRCIRRKAEMTVWFYWGKYLSYLRFRADSRGKHRSGSGKWRLDVIPYDRARVKTTPDEYVQWLAVEGVTRPRLTFVWPCYVFYHVILSTPPVSIPSRPLKPTPPTSISSVSDIQCTFLIKTIN